jgi:hypothetical protein
MNPITIRVVVPRSFVSIRRIMAGSSDDPITA